MTLHSESPKISATNLFSLVLEHKKRTKKIAKNSNHRKLFFNMKIDIIFVSKSTYMFYFRKHIEKWIETLLCSCEQFSLLRTCFVMWLRVPYSKCNRKNLVFKLYNNTSCRIGIRTYFCYSALYPNNALVFCYTTDFFHYRTDAYETWCT